MALGVGMANSENAACFSGAMVKRSAAMPRENMAALRLTMAPNPQSHAERTTSAATQLN